MLAPKHIPLTRGMFAIVDAEDFDRLNEYKWFANEGDGRWRATRSGSVKNGEKITVHMHREILSTPAGCEIDHINGNDLDNRKCNLRVSTHIENMRNMKMHKDNKSGYKGVSRHQGRWQVYIRVNNKNTRIGMFSDKLEAARAYDKAAIEAFGEFAKVNFPMETQ